MPWKKRVLLLLLIMTTYLILSINNELELKTITLPNSGALTIIDMPEGLYYNNTVIESTDDYAVIIVSYVNNDTFIRNWVYSFLDINKSMIMYQELSKKYSIVIQDGSKISVIETDLEINEDLLSSLTFKSITRLKGGLYV